jgi:hypothetical protein
MSKFIMYVILLNSVKCHRGINLLRVLYGYYGTIIYQKTIIHNEHAFTISHISVAVNNVISRFNLGDSSRKAEDSIPDEVIGLLN